jgi:hypothetical protein
MNIHFIRHSTLFVIRICIDGLICVYVFVYVCINLYVGIHMHVEVNQRSHDVHMHINRHFDLC